MNTLLIADDEYFVLERIKRILDYPSLGYELAGSYLNGRDALQAIRSIRPDAAILDIRMPYITGLEIAQTLKQEGIPTKVILLTSYDFFEYAKQAISYNVFAYLLKPLVKEELETTLLQLSDIISREKGQAVKTAQVEEILQTEHILSVLSGSRPTTDEFNDADTLYLIKISNPDNIHRFQPVIKTCFQNHDSEIMRKIVFIEENIICLTAMTNGDPEGCAAYLQQALASYIDMPFNIICTFIGNDPDNIPSQYRHAMNVLNDTLFMPSGSIVNADTKRSDHIHLSVDLTEKLPGAMRSGDTAVCRIIIEDAFAKLMQPEFACTINLELLLTQIYSVLSIAGTHFQNYSENSISFCVREIIMTRLECSSIREACVQLITEQIQQTQDFTENRTAEKLVSDVISFINDNYHDPDLNVSQIASHVSYSENHLSTLFRRQTGGSIVQYITKCRMQEAYRLLQEGMPVSQAAAITGYSSPYYFSRRFKQYYGFPPSVLLE